jgi:nucleotide-binding universal stress UspA family protein
MNKAIAKVLLAPVDGSSQGLKALDYAGRMFAADAAMQIKMVYVVPPLPPMLVQEARRDRDTAKMLEKMERRHVRTAELAIDTARERLLSLGFGEEQIRGIVHRKSAGVARGICSLSESLNVDAVVMTTRGRGRMEAFFMGATATKVADANAVCPVWLVKGNASAGGALIGLDPSECARRAVDHAGFMLAGLEQPVILFYSRRNLLRFIPSEALEAAPALTDVWQSRAGRQIAPVMQHAQQMLVQAGVAESRIAVKIVEGSRSAGADILKAAKEHACGTIVVGRHGETGHKTFPMGSVARTVVQKCEDMAVWIVP